MSHLLICGAAGCTNLGDDAILWGMLSQLRDALPGRAFRVAGGPEMEALVRPFDAAAISYHDRAELARAIEEADLVVLGGGGLLYDIGYDASLARLVGDPADRQWLYEMARVAAAASAAERPVMLYGVGAGPLITDASRRVAHFIGEQSKAVTVRDRASADVLAECGLPRTRLHIAADPSVALEPGDAEAGERLLEQSGVAAAPRPWIAVNLRSWYHSGGVPGGETEAQDRLVERAGAVVRGVREDLGGTAVLVPFQRLNDDDLRVLSRIAEAAGPESGVMVVEPALSPPEVVAMLARFDLVVGMRLHALLLALDAGVPFVGLSYAPKVDEFANAVGMADHTYSVAGLDPQAVIASCRALLVDRQKVQAALAERRREMQDAAGISAELAATLMETRRLSRATPPRRARSEKPAAEVRVLMQTRPDFREVPGGDVVQLEELIPHLREAGVAVELTGEEAPDLAAYDLVHTINLDRPDEPYRHCLNALRQGKPVVVSPVHTDMSEFLEWGDPDYWDLPDPAEGSPAPRRAPPADPIERRRRARRHQQRQAIIDWATAYLPNAQVDADYLSRAYGMDLSRTVVVPHGIAGMFFDARPEPFVEKHGLRDFVLCAGRVEARKNQLALVAAMRGTGIPLVIAGRPNPDEYRELCRRYADENVVFIDAMPQEELASACAAAKVHALVSWFEIPGLVSLEAGAAGCNVVATDRGSPREYLGDMAWYCDPRDIGSIREAVLAAYEAPRAERLREHIRANCTWRRAAERTLEGYRLALELHEAQGEATRPRATVEAMRRHADFLAKLAADREYEARRMREWGEAVEVELKRLQEEFERVTSRRLHRWASAAARAGWGILRALGVKR